MEESNQEHSLPSFYKIYLDESANNLLLPPAFVKKLELKGKFPENTVLKIHTGQEWKVKIEENGKRKCFGKGWLDFVKDIEIQVGDFLLFNLISNFNFQVSIFGPNGVQKNFSSASSATCKQNCICTSRILDADLEDVIEIEDDDKKDTELTSSEWKKDSINPCFWRVLTKSSENYMEVPNWFPYESGIKNYRIILRNKEGREWSVRVKRRSDGRIFLSHGWANFRKENKLKSGYTCSFQYFQCNGSRNGGFIQFEVVKEAARRSSTPPKRVHSGTRPWPSRLEYF